MPLPDGDHRHGQPVEGPHGGDFRNPRSAVAARNDARMRPCTPLRTEPRPGKIPHQHRRRHHIPAALRRNDGRRAGTPGRRGGQFAVELHSRRSPLRRRTLALRTGPRHAPVAPVVPTPRIERPRTGFRLRYRAGPQGGHPHRHHPRRGRIAGPRTQAVRPHRLRPQPPGARRDGLRHRLEGRHAAGQFPRAGRQGAERPRRNVFQKNRNTRTRRTTC